MKEFKSRILRTLKSFPLRQQGRVLHVEASDDDDDDDDFSSASPSPNFPTPKSASSATPKSLLLHPFQLAKQFDNQEEDDDDESEYFNNKENTVQSFSRPNPHSPTLFDPALLAAFRQAVADYNRRCNVEGCSPEGTGKQFVVLYTTSLRGIRKTFEDCNTVRMLLENLKVIFHERDVSMDMGYREEMWRLLESKVAPPRLFIGGRYIGGADEVVGLHEQGKLLPLLRCVPRERGGAACEGCGGMRFVVCAECNGSRKLYDEERSAAVRCPNCNENGLVPCPLCT